MPKPPTPEGPQLETRPTPPPSPGEPGVWFSAKDAGALRIYLEKLKGKCRQDDLIIDKANEYLQKH